MNQVTIFRFNSIVGVVKRRAGEIDRGSRKVEEEDEEDVLSWKRACELSNYGFYSICGWKSIVSR